MASIRACFAPAPGMAYLDSATYGLPPRATVDTMERALQAWSSGTGDWIEDWDRPSDSCRDDFASMIGARAIDIAGIPAASVGVGLVAASMQSGDEILVPSDEFTSTMFPVLVAQERLGCRVREVAFQDLADEISEPTRLVAFSLVQMQTGLAADLERVCERAGRVGARLLVDATQAVPFVDVAPVIDRIDYLVCAGYKHLLCPRGVGFLYVREDHWSELAPFNANWRAADDPFGRYFGGPLTLAKGAARFDVSRGWLPWVGATSSLGLLRQWIDAGAIRVAMDLARDLASRVGAPEPRASLVCVPIDDAAGARAALQAAGIRASVRGTSIRFAVHLYNTPADVDRAARAIRPFIAATPG